jgi:hypothetical protein
MKEEGKALVRHKGSLLRKGHRGTKLAELLLYSPSFDNVTLLIRRIGTYLWNAGRE